MSITNKNNKQKVSFFIKSLGCKVNLYDSLVLKRELLKRSFVELSKVEEKESSVNLLIVNTCAVTKKAITKDKQTIRELSKKLNPNKIIVMGCWPETDIDVCRKDLSLNKSSEGEIIFWGVGDLVRLADKLSKLFFQDLKKESLGKNKLSVPGDRSRYFLKIGDGCNQFCSYCIIPFARGRLKSRSSDDLVKEMEEVVSLGYREVVLSGIHLGKYGEDLREKINLTNLLKKFLKIKNIGRLRLSSIEVNEISPELINLIAKEKRICRHLHISLQSGSDDILRAMNRPNNSKFFADKVKRLRTLIPEIAITTDVIVGFPGENSLNFYETCKFVRSVNFSKVHVFPFSCHEKTRASKMKDKVESREIKDRAEKLRKISLELENKFYKKTLNNYKKKKMPVIIEAYGFDSGSWSSKTVRVLSEYSFDLNLNTNKLREEIKEDLLPGRLVNISMSRPNRNVLPRAK